MNESYNDLYILKATKYFGSNIFQKKKISILVQTCDLIIIIATFVLVPDIYGVMLLMHIFFLNLLQPNITIKI